MTELSGITITPGIMPAALKESLAKTVERVGARLIDTVRIDTTHFVCTEGRGQAWEKAIELNIPVVVPDWILGCEREGKIVGVRGYYLNADPSKRQVGPSVAQQQQLHSPSAPHSPPPQPGTPRTEITPPTPERTTNSRAPFNANGDQSDEEEPPTPPPKGRPDTGISESTTLADRTSISSGDKDRGQAPASSDEEDSEDEKTEKESGTSPVEGGFHAASLPGQRASSSDGKEEDGSFSDVAL